MDLRGLSLVPREAVRIAAVALFDFDDLSPESPDEVQGCFPILVLHNHFQFYHFLCREDDGDFWLGEIQVHRSYPNLTKCSDRVYYTPV
jgi:hypothetical protein